MPWAQVYDPFGRWWLSTLVAALPILVLIGLLAIFRVRPHLAALAGVTTALAAAVFGFHMPAPLAGMSFVYGFGFGVLKVAWVVVASIFLYDIEVETGQFKIMKHSVAGVTADRRLQVLLIAFCFGAILEGAAGFGAPVAITGAFMIGLGFKPFQAAALSLIANTTPVAWGALGIPVHTLALVSGLPDSDLSAMIGRILPLTAIIVPFWLVRAMAGWAETFEVLPAILVVGLSFGATQYFWSNHVDSNLVDIVAGTISLVATVLLLRVWQPKHVWLFEDERAVTQAAAAPMPVGRQAEGKAAQAAGARPTASSVLPSLPYTNVSSTESKLTTGPERIGMAGDSSTTSHYTREQILKAWMPFAILSVFVVLWGLPPMQQAMDRLTVPNFHNGGWSVPYLQQITRSAPVASKPVPEPAKYAFNWLSATGTACFLAAVVAGLLLKMDLWRIFKVFRRTLHRMRFAMIAICCLLGLGFIMHYSGMDAVLGIALTRTGPSFAFFGTLLGWLGTALSGSNTSSNALFGSLQRVTAQQLRLDPVLMCAANSAGGVMGKMINAQSLVVATAATGQVGNEGVLFRRLLWHSIALASIVGLIVLTYAYVFPGAVPHGLTFAH